MRYLSLFSGIEAASCAWEPLGWKAVAFAEIEKLPSAVLAHHYPEVPNLGDVTKITEHQIKDLGHIDIVVFGFPCQDLSVAGKRAGLKGERSGLFYAAMRIVRWSQARFAMFENVPGLFSSEQGRDFAAVVGDMVGMECHVPSDGWKNTGVALGPAGLIEWSVLDAQYFGVPQRRRRIFAIADFGDWRNRQPILLEQDSILHNQQEKQDRPESLPCLMARRPQRLGGSQAYVINGKRIRFFTPREYEMQQGFSIDYTAIPGATDSSRYKAIGNSMAVPCMSYIGQRIDTIHKAISALDCTKK